MVEQDEEIVSKLEETDGGCYGARFAEQGKRQGKTMKRMSNWESCNMKLNFSYNESLVLELVQLENFKNLESLDFTFSTR